MSKAFSRYFFIEENMKTLNFLWKPKKCEDFIVKEVANFEEGKNHYLYLLVKRNLNTKELAKKLNFSYAGLKDKFSISFQYVSFDSFYKEKEFKKIDKGSWYYLCYLKTIKKKIKVGNLKGNKFLINIKNFPIKESLPKLMINYFDTQRFSKNVKRGKKLIKEGLRSFKRPNWLKSFFINSYLSYLWNKAIYSILSIYPGYFIEDKGFKFYILENENNLLLLEQKYFPILGYKVKLNNFEKNVYEKILNKEGFSLDEIIEKLKKINVKGDYRKIYIKPQNISFLANKTFIKFFLEKGAYATMFLKHIQKI